MRVTLDHSTHTYKDQKGQFYKAVSSVISEYKHPFDAYAKQANGKTLISNYVEKHGESEQYWLDKWEAKKDFACEKGTAFHNLKELVVNSQSYHPVHGKLHRVRNFEQQWQIAQREGLFHLLEPGVYTEMVLWNYIHRIAGTPDKTIIHEDGTFDIDDYKTNGEFKTQGFKGRVMKWPFIELPDAHLGYYTVQLSLYAWMLVQFGLKPGKLRLLHYDIPDSQVPSIVRDGILPDIEPTIYEVPYIEELIDTIMKDRLLQLKKQQNDLRFRRKAY